MGPEGTNIPSPQLVTVDAIGIRLLMFVGFLFENFCMAQ